MLFLRPRAYSKSVNVAPFLVNYSGALFREYPGPWQARALNPLRQELSSGGQCQARFVNPVPFVVEQVMLKQDSGELACVAEGPDRYPLGEARLGGPTLLTQPPQPTRASVRRLAS